MSEIRGKNYYIFIGQLSEGIDDYYFPNGDYSKNALICTYTNSKYVRLSETCDINLILLIVYYGSITQLSC